MRSMSFEEFKSWTADSIIGMMPAEYEKAEVKIHDVEKPGARYTGLTVRKTGQMMAATVDLDKMYSIYQSGAPEEKILLAMAEIAAMQPPGPVAADLGFEDYEKVKDRLSIRLLSLQTVHEMLESIPHRIIGDMALAYSVVACRGESDLWTMMVSNELLKEWKITEEQLHEDALASSMALFPVSLDTMSSIISKASGPLHAEAEGPEIMVISNRVCMYGASAILYPGVLSMVETEMGEGFYIVPSSVNEMLLVPESLVADPEELLRTHLMVSSQTDPSERLSYRIFRFDSQSGRLVDAAPQAQA